MQKTEWIKPSRRKAVLSLRAKNRTKMKIKETFWKIWKNVLINFSALWTALQKSKLATTCYLNVYKIEKQLDQIKIEIYMRITLLLYSSTFIKYIFDDVSLIACKSTGFFFTSIHLKEKK